jgi:hypothetical protein
MDITSVRYGPQIAAAATQHHIDPQLLAAVAAQETGGPGSSSGNNVVGDGGHGHGVFQIDDRTWSFAKTSAAMDPAQNANFAAGILADNLQRYGGNVKMALSAYNAGSPTATGTTTTWGDGQTLGYADSVMKHYDELSATNATTEQLAADSGENSASVNALLNAFSSFANGSASGTASSSTSSSAALASTIAQAPLISATNSGTLTPTRSWTQLDGQAQQPGQNADNAMVSLMDQGDAFSGDGDD